MSGWLGILVGVLAACGTRLLLRDAPARRAVGVVLLGIALNLLVFAMTGAEHLRAPLVEPGDAAPRAPFADPVPQALVLTAIVIGFALQAFALVLLTRTGPLDGAPEEGGGGVSTLVIAPVLVALIAGTLALLVAQRAQRVVLAGGALVHLGVCLALFARVLAEGVQAYHLGGWAAPVGIAFAADTFSAVLILLTGILGAAVALQVVHGNPSEVTDGRPALVFFLLAGVDAAFLTTDLFHLYVAFELLLLASFVLLVAGGGRRERAAAVRYLVPGVLSSMLLLAGVGLTYGLTGTLFLPEAGARIAEQGSSPAVGAVAGLLALAFALKASVFPMFAWLPASYPAASSAMAALFSGLLTKVGVYALVRVFTLVFPAEMSWLGPVLLAAAAATMVVGVLGALTQWEMQRLLTFHVVSQVGYLVAGFALGSTAALASTVFYVFHNSVAKACLLLGSGLVRARRGTDRLRDLGGLVRTDPVLGAAFLVAALALAGIPPLSGFWAKLMVLGALVEGEAWIVLGVAACVGLLTLVSMAKIWTTAFWGPGPDPARPATGRRWTELAPVVVLALVTVALGLLAGPAMAVAQQAAGELLEPSAYVEALRRSGP